ncbi:MAG TPA: cytochrome P450 [Parachlamydiaceae bacterium]|nr:cytochrome P450 [Parachlamydiaceae bacterium]
MTTSTSNIAVSFIPKSQWDLHGIKQNKSSWISWLVSFPAKCLEKIHNTALMILDVKLLRPKLSDVNLLRPFSRYIDTAPHIVTVPTLAERFHLSSDPEVMRAILDNYHNDSQGIFMGGRVMGTIIDFFKELYPEEIITREDFLLSCQPENLREYLSVINTFLNPGRIGKCSDGILSVVQNEIAHWETASKCDKGVNVTEATKVFATTVIFKLIFGLTLSDDDTKAVIKALDSLNQYIVGQYALTKDLANRVLFNRADKENMFSVLRRTVDNVLNASQGQEVDYLIKSMKDSGTFSPIQVKIMIITMLMAGQETTAAVLSYAIWQLAQSMNHKHIESIRQEIRDTGYDTTLSKQNVKLSTVENVIIEALRMHPAAYVISRDAGMDLACVITDRTTQKVVKTHFITKGEGVNPCPYFAARNPEEFPCPEVFNPERHKGAFTKLTWLPFSAGVEKCPGQWLAKNEMRLFLTHLVSSYDLSTPDADIRAKGLLTLKLDEDIWVSLKKRT